MRTPLHGNTSLVTLVMVFRSKALFSFLVNCKQLFYFLFNVIHQISREDAYWQQPLAYQAKDVKLLVKHVFITNQLGEDSLPKWASWVKVVIDGTLILYLFEVFSVLIFLV